MRGQRDEGLSRLPVAPETTILSGAMHARHCTLRSPSHPSPVPCHQFTLSIARHVALTQCLMLACCTGPDKFSTEQKPIIKFGADRGGCSFEIKLDDSRWISASSPLRFKQPLQDGNHTFMVREGTRIVVERESMKGRHITPSAPYPPRRSAPSTPTA
jgi:hypothetical protein